MWGAGREVSEGTPCSEQRPSLGTMLPGRPLVPTAFPVGEPEPSFPLLLAAGWTAQGVTTSPGFPNSPGRQTDMDTEEPLGRVLWNSDPHSCQSSLRHLSLGKGCVLVSSLHYSCACHSAHVNVHIPVLVTVKSHEPHSQEIHNECSGEGC